MSRLIDADALIEDLKGSLFYSDAIPFVEDAPTAYDIEKVVEELEEVKNRYCFMGYQMAIDIVKRGGVE